MGRGYSWTFFRSWTTCCCLFNNTMRTGPRPQSQIPVSQNSRHRGTQGHKKALIVVFYNLTLAPASHLFRLRVFITSIPRMCLLPCHSGLGLQCHNQPITALSLPILTHGRPSCVKECLAAEVLGYLYCARCESQTHDTHDTHDTPWASPASQVSQSQHCNLQLALSRMSRRLWRCGLNQTDKVITLSQQL